MPGHDYTRAGTYYVTLVTQGRECLFGDVIGTDMRSSDYGRIADECWAAIPDHFPNVELGAYVVMPNHVHGIVVINKPEPAVVVE